MLGGRVLLSPPDAVLAESYEANGPGAAVVVMQGGKIVYTGARGMADIAGGKPITSDTVFRLGSITKQFAAAVIVQLAQEGKLLLDETVTHEYKLAEVNEGYEDMREGRNIRGVILHDH